MLLKSAGTLTALAKVALSSYHFTPVALSGILHREIYDDCSYRSPVVGFISFFRKKEPMLIMGMWQAMTWTAQDSRRDNLEPWNG
ncbi:uncharacterized protein F4807DRAFT_432250 [Annulohypoxylon truncatum]|uniref:uncharacterized protein n=1 Tax=Annulohypoxylon truncatum TaxID=327061 RepID=UPI002007A498|nr:uncharacterized protein F4807DRAFT_432250 [Annulohypoxylon truncatum]KAI1208272.1 hypothetical protein F4807DRAFT_432250 [Annulohypoxylon truncatum]